MAYSTYTKSELQALFELHGNKCLACGSTNKLSIDHVEPISLGGLDVLENIQPLCLPCNLRKGAKNIDYRLNPCQRTGRESPAFRHGEG